MEEKGTDYQIYLNALCDGGTGPTSHVLALLQLILAFLLSLKYPPFESCK
jgi:hypothetical protein